jgi:hypothetical protein
MADKFAATWEPLISLFAHLSFRKSPPPGQDFCLYNFLGRVDAGGVYFSGAEILKKFPDGAF